MKLRLFLAIAGVLALILLGQDLPLARYLRASERDRVQAGVERDAFILAGSANEVLEPAPSADTGAVRRLSTTLTAYATKSRGRVVVVDLDGIAIAASDPADVGRDFSSRPEIAAALAGAPFDGTRTSATAGTDLFFVSVPVLSGATVRGAVRISFPRSDIDDRVEPSLRGLILVFAISMVAALLVALLLANQLSRPLRRLQHSTEQLAGGDFSAAADSRDGPREVRQLADSFNSMTARIEDLVSRQRRFAADASHQLRSPLTALRLQLELASASDDPAVVDGKLEAAIGETERLQHLIDGLLFLTRAAAVPESTENIPLGPVIVDRVETWSAMAAERGVALVSRIEPDLTATVVPGAMEQILDNVLDNALAVSPDGSTIEVWAATVAGEIEVHVVDEGPGLEASHLERAFDRFWRSPEAVHQGSGLGLAIVDQLARSSGGTAAAANRADRSGLDVSVRIPAARRLGVPDR